MRLFKLIALLLISLSLLPGCSGGRAEIAREPPLVRVARLETAQGRDWSTSGTVRAQFESPLAFRVSGQIMRREVSAGDRVRKGQLLMSLDERDLHQQLISARARLSSLRTQAENAVAERERFKKLLGQELISARDYDNARTAAEAALQQVAAAEAELAQARNAAGYASLEAPADGTLLEVLAEPGQVVTAGQAVATLAQDGPREVEIFVPQSRRAELPDTARLVLDNQRIMKTRLREVAGAADPQTRTWRARYQIVDDDPPALGQVVRLHFDQSGVGGAVYRIPLGALSERGAGPRIWVIRGQQVFPEPVGLLRLDAEDAWISTDLPVHTPIVALGTHLLNEGQAVRMNE